MVRVHELKTLPEYFEEVLKGTKTFEVRKNDRCFQVGDELILREWDGKEYTGRGTSKVVSYILDDTEYVKYGYVIMGFEIGIKS